MTKRAHGMLLASALALAGTGAEAQAQEAVPLPPASSIKVGIIDTDASAVGDERKGVTVHHQSFLDPGQVKGSHRTASGREHGADVASAFLDQSWRIDPAKRVEIYSAMAFYRSGNDQIDEQKNRPMKINMAAASRALDWFKENGVRTVITSFVMRDSRDMSAFMEKASQSGITVYASTHNTQVGFEPFPARHPDAISVTGNSRNLDFETNGSMRQWVMFQADAGIPGKSLTVTPENGSSFAVARVAAFGAHLVNEDPRISRTEVVDKLRDYAPSTPHGVPSLAGREPIIRIRTQLNIPDPTDVAIISMGPSKPKKSAFAAQAAAMASLAR